MPKQKPKEELLIIPNERTVGKIYLIRGKKVMFDRDLAELYAVETKALNRAVKRNKERFPEDFMFQLNKQESDMFLRFQFGILNEETTSKFSRSQFVTLKKTGNLKCQIGTSSWGGKRKPSYVFTEQGVAMLSAVLRSQRAVNVSIQIVRTFVNLREMLTTHKDLREKIEKMERKNNQNFKVIFDVIKRLIATDNPGKAKKIGF